MKILVLEPRVVVNIAVYRRYCFATTVTRSKISFKPNFWSKFSNSVGYEFLAYRNSTHPVLFIVENRILTNVYGHEIQGGRLISGTLLYGQLQGRGQLKNGAWPHMANTEPVPITGSRAEPSVGSGTLPLISRSGGKAPRSGINKFAPPLSVIANWRV